MADTENATNDRGQENDQEIKTEQVTDSVDIQNEATNQEPHPDGIESNSNGENLPPQNLNENVLPPEGNLLPDVAPPRVEINNNRDYGLKTTEHFSKTGIELPELSPRKAELGRIPSPTLAEKREREKRMKMLQATRPRLPNNMVRMARVAMCSRESRRPTPMREHATYMDQQRSRSQKVVTWDEANNARPPLRIDMDTPGPTSYTPRNKPLKEDNSPEWSFGRRTFVEKEGGARTAWDKTWFQSPHIYQQKTDFYSDRRWPAPTFYRLKPAVGRQSTADMQTSPSFTLGPRRSNMLNKKGSEVEPSPNEYEIEKTFHSLKSSAPAFTLGLRRGGTYIWNSKDYTPGPGYYSPDHQPSKTQHPAFSIQGQRREKSHVLGPFATF